MNAENDGYRTRTILNSQLSLSVVHYPALESSYCCRTSSSADLRPQPIRFAARSRCMFKSACGQTCGIATLVSRPDARGILASQRNGAKSCNAKPAGQIQAPLPSPWLERSPISPGNISLSRMIGQTRN